MVLFLRSIKQNHELQHDINSLWVNRKYWKIEIKRTSRMPSASMMMVQVPGFSTNGSTKLFWGTFTNVGSELGAKMICLDCSEPGRRKSKGENNTIIKPSYYVRLHVHYSLIFCLLFSRTDLFQKYIYFKCIRFHNIIHRELNSDK